MRPMTIGGLAREAGVGVETVRFYERKGLIAQPRKPDFGGGFRVYPDEAVARIRFIRRAQELGFSLREIDELLCLRADPSTDARDVRDRATAKLDEVERKIAELERIRSALRTVIAACPGSGAIESCSIIEAMTPEEERRAG